MAKLYRVIMSGRTLSGAPLDAVREAVAQMFKLQGAQLERMLSGQPLSVSRGITAEAAENLRQRLQAVDLEARVEALPEVETTPPTPVAVTPQTLPSLPPLPTVAVAPTLAPTPTPTPTPTAAATPVAPGAAAGGRASDELFALQRPVAAPPASAAGAGQGAAPATPAAPAAKPALALVDDEALAADADEGTVCPKCGEVQPKRTLCRQCGLDMPRFRKAQEEAAQQAREEQAAAAEIRRLEATAPVQHYGDDQAGLIGFGFAGRFGRLDFLSSGLIGACVLFFSVWLAIASRSPWLSMLGSLVTMIYVLRGHALRLHDLGRSGWLALIALVPGISFIMWLLLLFVGGDAGSNEYGDEPADDGGKRLLASFVVFFITIFSIVGYAEKHPERWKEMAQMRAQSRGHAVAEEEETASPESRVVYSASNHVDLYVMNGCSACENMESWLAANDIDYTVYSVDRDEAARQRLQIVIGQNRRVILPVLEVNDTLLHDNPSLSEVHSHLRRQSL